MKKKRLACILTTVLACILTAILGTTPYSFAFAMENNNQQIIFNQNNFESDTHGNFPGSVSFVQNSIMPSHHGVQNDVQPHLTSLRKTMVLFKPKENHSQVIMTAKNSNNEIVDQGMMITPDKLTKIAGQTDFNGEISKPSEFGRTISDNATLSNFENDPEGQYFQELFNLYNSIHIQTSDGNWTRDFHLPDGEQFSNKVVTFNSNAGYNSNIFYTNNSLTLSRGNEFTLKNVDGIWYSSLDIELNKIAYISKTFSSILPASIIEPGLQLSFKSGNKESEVTNLNIGAPNELIIHTIDLGMLTSPRDEFSFQKDPELHRQYFQQLPISSLTVSEYEPQYFTEVMLPNGDLLTDFDPSQGGVYDGTMRQKIAKILVSHGIDNANYGINSSGGGSERWHPFSSAQFTAHNAVGKYVNGVQVHGLSGGNGMVTLESSIGNEFSHELGHNFGLGHYPGGFNGAIDRPADQVNSTWGWDADHNFFIPNFEKIITNKEQCYESECTLPFVGHRFGKGAMSGGAPLYTVQNGYTLHTPYELNKIQNFSESKAVFSPDSPTGFSKWDANSKQMSPWKNMVNNDLMTASNSQVERKPYKQGVPIATIVGYYDPNKQLSSYIYPALHGSFGAVYEDNFTDSTCKLNVFTRNSGTKVFNLHTRRLDQGYMNKIHVNIEEALKPYSANVSCDGNILASIELNEPQQELNTSVVSTKSEIQGCIVDVDTKEEYCLPVGGDAGYSLPEFIYNKPVYVKAPQGTAVVLSDWDNLSYNRIATFIGTVSNDDLKNVKANNGEFLDFSHPRSMKVVKSSEPLGCIVSLDTQDEYCLPVGGDAGYSLPEFIYNKPVYVRASEGTAVVLSDWDNLSYNRIAAFNPTVSHFDLKNVRAQNGEYLDFSHPRSMAVVNR
ncbi:MAG: hypothetical protein F6K40_27460 [Okeania sp. SIO3I5]|uniref:M66 family metalloprotease n=1 Tax=Okeania sp. SIO3I5 TaxID=2607805 RepID=UPI0013B822F7|nr:M66 family metalloprotease [Okeania sp. SIO3I5]NEQ39784.1 hypothetical protein [Okeania sp. SIO3I5]